MLDQKELNEFSTGDAFALFLVVTRSQVKSAKNGRPYLDLELRDKSTALPAKVWDRVDDISNKIKEGTIVKVAGVIEEFNGAPQIKIDKIRPSQDEDDVKAEDFLPKSRRPLNKMLDELNQAVASIKDPYLSRLIKVILSGESYDKFIRAPAGKGWHHAYIHGLLEHTLEIIRICDLICSVHTNLNRDLLICGALLHDFGKTDELIYDSVFDYSDRGKLIGHIIIGALEVEKAAAAIPDFPQDLKTHLIHLVLSHQGKLEFASPVEPKTLEAIALYQADELSAKTNAYKYAIEADKNKGSTWTKFLPLANTSLFIPNEKFDADGS
ncbi:MAG: HD domain-containing protein [Bacteroidota bacterium]